MTSTDLLKRLEAETRAEHAAADAPWLGLVGGRLTAERYRDHLARVYGFDAPLESALAYTPRLGQLLVLGDHARSGLIAQDLIALGLPAARVTRLPCVGLSPFECEAEALGWLYVRERATLLFQAVRTRILWQHPDLECACAYLASCDGITDDRWQDLGEALERVARTQGAAEAVVDAAREAFAVQNAWFGVRDLEATA